MSKLLIIDAQVVHTAAMQRGVGKYSAEYLTYLLQANKQQRNWDSIKIIVSSELDINSEVTKLLDVLSKDAEIVHLPLERDLIYDSATISSCNRQIIDRYVEQLSNSEVVDYLIIAPLQGGTCSVFPSIKGVKKHVICYDLIPLMFYDIYYNYSVGRRENLTKLDELLKADSFLTISQTVANDLAVNLGVHPDRISNIDGGPIDHGIKTKAVEVKKPFILMPTGNDPRKNNLNAVKGYKTFSSEQEDQYSLVITSFFDDNEIDQLKNISSDIIFSGNISNEELKYLYQNCQMVLFPSIYEGLGLPVLEAVHNLKPIACSDISVIREMSTQAFNLFDPSSPHSISQAISKTISQKIDLSIYRSILEKYNWPSTISRSITAMNESISASPKQKATLYTVNPEVSTLSSKITQRAYAELNRTIEVSWLIESPGSSENDIKPNLLSFANSSDILLPEMAINSLQPLTIYEIANDEHYGRILFAALANPGIVIIYDTNLTQLWECLLEQKLINQSRLDYEKGLQQKLISTGTYMLGSLIANQLAVVVFDEVSQDRVASVIDILKLDVPIRLINYPVGSLVYPDIIPKHRSRLIEITDKNEIYRLEQDKSKEGYIRKTKIPYNNYFEYEKELSLASFLLVNDELTYQDLEAFKYGVLPTDGKQFGIQSSKKVEKQPKLLFNSSLMTFAAKNPKHLQSKLARDYSYKLFAEKLSDILIELEKGRNNVVH